MATPAGRGRGIAAKVVGGAKEGLLSLPSHGQIRLAQGSRSSVRSIFLLEECQTFLLCHNVLGLMITEIICGPSFTTRCFVSCICTMIGAIVVRASSVVPHWHWLSMITCGCSLLCMQMEEKGQCVGPKCRPSQYCIRLTSPSARWSSLCWTVLQPANVKGLPSWEGGHEREGPHKRLRGRYKASLSGSFMKDFMSINYHATSQILLTPSGSLLEVI
jgi:hypothetical protein